MDEFEESKLRLLHQQNLTFSEVINNNIDIGNARKFKQQYNSKLNNKFDGSLNYEEGFRYTDIGNDSSLKNLQIEIRNNRGRIKLDENESKKINIDVCFGCNNLFVAGINMSMRIGYEGKKKQRKNGKENKTRKGERFISMKCLVCGTETVLKKVLLQVGEGEKREKAEKIEGKEYMGLNTLPLVGGEMGTNSRELLVGPGDEGTNGTDVKKPQKKKRKKGKKDGLGELLRRKQEEKAAESSGGSGGSGLFSFLGV